MQNLESLLVGSHRREWSDIRLTHIWYHLRQLTLKLNMERTGGTSGVYELFLLFSPANTMGNCKTAHAENELLVLCKFHKLSVVHRSCWFFQVSHVQRITESVILDHKVDQRTCKLVYRINSKMVSGANMSWLMWICFFRLLFGHWCRSIRCLNMFVGDMCKVAPVELMLKLGVIIDLSFV